MDGSFTSGANNKFVHVSARSQFYFRTDCSNGTFYRHSPYTCVGHSFLIHPFFMQLYMRCFRGSHACHACPVTLNLARLQKRSGRLSVNTLPSPSPSPKHRPIPSPSQSPSPSPSPSPSALARVSLIVSARNISTVILYRPDHICQDHFCRDSPILFLSPKCIFHRL